MSLLLQTPETPLRESSTRYLIIVAWLIVAVSAVEFGSMLPAFFARAKTDFAAFYNAALLVRAGQADNIYDFNKAFPKVAVNTQAQYLYPPIFAVMTVPFTFVGYQWAGRLWTTLSLLLIAHSLYLLGRNGTGLKIPSKWLLPLLLILGLRSPALYEDLLLGNCNVLILWLTVVTVFAACTGKDVVAGVALAFAVLIKLSPAPLLLYFVLAWRPRVLLAFGATVVLVSGATLLVTGPSCLHGFISAQGRLSHEPPSTTHQSLWGIIQRFLVTGRETVAVVNWPEAASYIWYVLVIAVAAATILRVRSRRHDALYCLALLLCMTILLSPVTRRSHLGVLLIPVLWMLGQLAWVWPPRPAVLGVGTFLLLTLLIPDPTYKWPIQNPLLLVLVSKQGIGAAVIWLVLILMGHTSTETRPARNLTLAS